MSKTDFNANEFVDQHLNRLQQVGDVCLHWSSTEQRVEEIIWLILDIEENVGHTLTGPIDMRGRFRLLKNLAALRLKKGTRHPAYKKIQQASNLVDEIHDDRMLVVHGNWQYFLPSFDTTVTKWRGKHRGIPRPLDDSLFTNVRSNLIRASMHLVRAGIIISDERHESSLPK